MVVHVALVSKAQGISLTALSRAASAIQKQVLRDFGPIWNVQASVDSFPHLEDVPLGAWPVVILDGHVSPPLVASRDFARGRHDKGGPR